jgi:alkanesulfonate monooxygenase SsuD/methylene tetrahydromethanopterin reductase-like flavin-dependent oxidoreductase (luciferase family)
MRFGLFGGPLGMTDETASHRRAYEQYLNYVTEAERLGFESVFITEHHFTGLGQATAPFLVLSHLAARTTTLRLGTGITVLPWYGPMAALENAATLDVLSGGRLDFGVGKGFRANEYDGFCMSADEITPRYEEALAVIRKGWDSEDRWSYEGDYWSFSEVLVEPRPIQKPHPPMWVGAGSQDSLRRAVDLGFNVLMDQIGSFDQTAERVRIVRERQQELGVESSPFDIAVTRSLNIVDSPEEREQVLAEREQTMRRVAELATRGRGAANRMAAAFLSDIRKATEEGGIVGDTDECIDRLERLQEAGVEYVLLAETENTPETLRRFAREIMPRFSGRQTADAAAAAE